MSCMIIHVLLQHSWKWFIYYRCQNVNRTSGANKSDQSSHKRPKLIDKNMHLYPPTHAEDEISYRCNVGLLKEEQLKAKPRVQVLMKRTFSNRWSSFLDESPTLSVYLVDFPLLMKPVYVCQSTVSYSIIINFIFPFFRLPRNLLLCKKPTIRDDFECSFPQWARAIVCYCKDTQLNSSAH